MRKNLEFINSIDSSEQYSDDFYEQYIAGIRIKSSHGNVFLFFKRAIDVTFSLLVLLVLLIPICMIGIIIRIDSPGPAFFRNRRIGRGMKPFECIKFRTMRTDAPPDVPSSRDVMDTYVTPIGHFLRKTSIDEIPQFINILLGDMSIIGYRPLVPNETECNEMRNRLNVFSMKPGISGISQVNGRDKVYYKNKAIMDAYYTEHASILLDFKIMFKTLLVVLKMSGNDDAAKVIMRNNEHI